MDERKKLVGGKHVFERAHVLQVLCVAGSFGLFVCFKHLPHATILVESWVDPEGRVLAENLEDVHGHVERPEANGKREENRFSLVGCELPIVFQTIVSVSLKGFFYTLVQSSGCGRTVSNKPRQDN